MELRRHRVIGTPLTFYLDLRLAKADELLRRTRLAIPEVAGLCGFANAAHFSRALRADTGQTPTARRQRD